jgi:lysozyme
MDWTKPAEQQADFFSGLLAKDPGEIPPVLDYEYRVGIPSAGTARLECKAFLERVRANLGKTPIIYTGNDYWKNYGSADAYWTQYPLWIAYPAAAPIWPAPWTTWLFWQYSWKGDGLLYGAESLEMDMNYFQGDSAKLHATFGGVSPAPAPAPLTLEQRVKRLEDKVFGT